MEKSRRDHFENQLRDLQNDISHLSEKLSVPTASTSRYDTTNASFASVRRDSYLDSSNTGLLDQSRSSVLGQSFSSTEHSSVLEKLRQDLHHSKKERDDALYRLQQAKMEVEELRKHMIEAARLKASYEHFKQDYESLRISLESSERIRKQQKELISLLQRSHSVAAAATDANSSVLSFNTASSISMKGGDAQQSFSRVGVPITTAAEVPQFGSTLHVATGPYNETTGAGSSHLLTTADEHRQWLNSYSGAPSAPHMSIENAENRMGADSNGVNATKRIAHVQSVREKKPRSSGTATHKTSSQLTSRSARSSSGSSKRSTTAASSLTGTAASAESNGGRSTSNRLARRASTGDTQLTSTPASAVVRNPGTAPASYSSSNTLSSKSNSTSMRKSPHSVSGRSTGSNSTGRNARPIKPRPGGSTGTGAPPPGRQSSSKAIRRSASNPAIRKGGSADDLHRHQLSQQHQQGQQQRGDESYTQILSANRSLLPQSAFSMDAQGASQAKHRPIIPVRNPSDHLNSSHHSASSSGTSGSFMLQQAGLGPDSSGVSGSMGGSDVSGSMGGSGAVTGYNNMSAHSMGSVYTQQHQQRYQRQYFTGPDSSPLGSLADANSSEIERSYNLHHENGGPTQKAGVGRRHLHSAQSSPQLGEDSARVRSSSNGRPPRYPSVAIDNMIGSGGSSGGSSSGSRSGVDRRHGSRTQSLNRSNNDGGGGGGGGSPGVEGVRGIPQYHPVVSSRDTMAQQQQRLARSQTAPPGGKVLYRPVPSPSSTFATANRTLDL